MLQASPSPLVGGGLLLPPSPGGLNVLSLEKHKRNKNKQEKVTLQGKRRKQHHPDKENTILLERGGLASEFPLLGPPKSNFDNRNESKFKQVTIFRYLVLKFLTFTYLFSSFSSLSFLFPVLVFVFIFCSFTIFHFCNFAVVHKKVYSCNVLLVFEHFVGPFFLGCVNFDSCLGKYV